MTQLVNFAYSEDPWFFDTKCHICETLSVTIRIWFCLFFMELDNVPQNWLSFFIAFLKCLPILTFSPEPLPLVPFGESPIRSIVPRPILKARFFFPEISIDFERKQRCLRTYSSWSDARLPMEVGTSVRRFPWRFLWKWKRTPF